MVHYRDLGLHGKWTTRKLLVSRGWVAGTSIPAADTRTPGLEMGLSFSENPRDTMAYGPIAISVLPRMAVDKTPRQIVPFSTQSKLTATIKDGQTAPIELVWNEIPDSDFYKVFRNGALVVETGVAFFPDSPPEPSGTYIVEAWRDGKVIARSEPLKYTVADHPFDEKFDVQIHANSAGVVFNWPAPKSPFVAAYRINRNNGESSRELAKVNASKSGSQTYWDNPPAGNWTITITPVNAFGRASNPVSITVNFQPKQDFKPVIDLPLGSSTSSAKATGSVLFENSAAVFNGGGYITLPHQDNMNLKHGMTLTFRFRADDLDGMPVLICHGLYGADGWFVQLMNNQLVFRAANGDAWGTGVEKGKWYDVRVVFDGSKLRLAMNGKWIDQDNRPVSDKPATRDLVIGNYDSKEATFAFNGAISEVKIYDDVVLE